MKRKNIFFSNHTKNGGSFIHYTRSFPNVNYRTRLLTNEALEELRTTIANFNAWTYNGTSENELK
jgi:D-lactate dehydrogenase